MKTLSIQQPWATIEAMGIKDIENRTWATKHRGRIYIHASGKPWSWDKVIEYITPDRLDFFLENNYLPSWIKTLPTSAIIGEVDIVDCVINHPSIWADKSYHDPYDTLEADSIIYNWVLANPVLYDEPILNVKGKLSLWEFNK